VSAVRQETVPCTPTWTVELQDAKIIGDNRNKVKYNEH